MGLGIAIPKSDKRFPITERERERERTFTFYKPTRGKPTNSKNRSYLSPGSSGNTVARLTVPFAPILPRNNLRCVGKSPTDNKSSMQEGWCEIVANGRCLLRQSILGVVPTTVCGDFPRRRTCKDPIALAIAIV